VVIFPFPSLNVHVTTVVPCVVIGKVVVVVPVTVPTQLSAVVGAVGVTEHSPVMLAKVGVTGAVTSSTMIFWLAVVMFPFPSLKVHVTTVVPCVVIGNVVVVVPVTVPTQLSVVVGVAGVTEHCPVTFDKVGVTGFVTSSIITFWLAVVIFPFPSLNVHVTTVVPWVVMGKVVDVVPVIVPAQLSVVVGAVGVTEHCPVTFDKVGVTGLVTSSTITV